MNRLAKFIITNPEMIKAGGPMTLEEEFEIWKNSLTEEQLRAIQETHGSATEAVWLAYVELQVQ